MICTGETECGGMAGQAAGITIQIGSGDGATVIVTGALGINTLGMVIGAQAIGTGISGTILGTIPMYMVQELVG